MSDFNIGNNWQGIKLSNNILSFHLAPIYLVFTGTNYSINIDLIIWKLSFGFSIARTLIW